MSALDLYINSLSKDEKDILKFIFYSDKAKSYHRKLYFAKRFLFWMLYYFTAEFKVPIAQFHIDYANALQNGKNVFFVGFRESAKSMILTYYYVWCIVHNKRHFILHYNSELEQAKAMLRDIIYILETNEKLIYDYWRLYKPETKTKKETKNPKKVSEFITENWVKLKAMSMGKSPRWQKFIYNWETYRPDLIWFDDIDTIHNTKNPELIKKDLDFILNEVLWGAASYFQLVILWNVVRDKWRSLELKKHFEKDNSFQVFWLPVYDLNTKEIVWKERFVHTDKEAKQINKHIQDPKEQVISLETRRRQQWLSAFNANYLLIPMKDSWESIIKKSHIHFYNWAIPSGAKYIMWIDPAFSEKTNTDPIWITITAHHKFEWTTYKYVVFSTQLTGENKYYENFVRFVKNLYVQYKINIIYIEQNNGWKVLADILKRNNLAVKTLNSTKDKITRLREFEGEIQTWVVKFNPDSKQTWELIQQLVEFPNVEHDDMVDSFVFSLYPYTGWDIKVF